MLEHYQSHMKWKQIFVEKQVITEFFWTLFTKELKNEGVMKIADISFHFVLICTLPKSDTFGHL